MKRFDDHFLLALAIAGFIVLLLPESKLELLRQALMSLLGSVHG